MTIHGLTPAAPVFLAVAFSALASFAGNKANPDAVELVPLPMPVEYKSDMDNPVTFDATTTVTVECPDAAAVEWLSSHFAEWYGNGAPKVKLSALNSQLSTSPEAYVVSANASAGVKIAARSLAGVRWAAYSLRQLAIAKRGTMKTEGRILPTLTISDHPHLAFRAVHLCWFPEVNGAEREVWNVRYVLPRS